MTEAEEDAILKQAAEIRHRHFAVAEKKWAETPDHEKQRPWPRCHNITCNRTLVCKTRTGAGDCEGWEY